MIRRKMAATPASAIALALDGESAVHRAPASGVGDLEQHLRRVRPELVEAAVVRPDLVERLDQQRRRPFPRYARDHDHAATALRAKVVAIAEARGRPPIRKSANPCAAWKRQPCASEWRSAT